MLASVSDESLPAVGDDIAVRVPPERIHLFDDAGQAMT
jgi:hypothetical protein